METTTPVEENQEKKHRFYPLETTHMNNLLHCLKYYFSYLFSYNKEVFMRASERERETRRDSIERLFSGLS